MTDEEGAQLRRSLRSQALMLANLIDRLVLDKTLAAFDAFAMIGPEETEDPHPEIGKLWQERKEDLRLRSSRQI